MRSSPLASKVKFGPPPLQARWSLVYLPPCKQGGVWFTSPLASKVEFGPPPLQARWSLGLPPCEQGGVWFTSPLASKVEFGVRQDKQNKIEIKGNSYEVLIECDI